MSSGINRRRFLHGAAAIGSAALAGRVFGADAPAVGGSAGVQVELKGPDPKPVPTGPAQKVFPRWKGFNFTYFFNKWSDRSPLEDDFRWLRDWGFDFIRLPSTYKFWTDDKDVYKVKEESLAKIDAVIDWGRKYNLHISFNFHRGPGYCVNPDDTEPFNIWKDNAALDAFCWHWALFAKRYKGVASKSLSFDLLNEPLAPDGGQMTGDDYARVVRAATKAIRDADPERLIIADGVRWGNQPCPDLADLNIGQSCRGYSPMEISHYKASWVNGERFAEPIWPDPEKKNHQWDRARLEELYKPWVELASRGVGVHCGECGAFNKTPHAVFLAWFRDVLDILKGYNIGFALWNFRGSFGILDSERADVAYEDFHGRKLDRKLLSLLQTM
jgi:endoglucanase